jgi:hypothetical protein
MKKQTEIWNDVKDYEGLYEISSHGRLRSLDRVVLRCDGVLSPKKGKIKAFKIHRKGYLFCALSKNNKQKSMRIHRMVALAFIPNVFNKAQVNHIDGIKENNTVSNLEWCTNLENKIHAQRNHLCNLKLVTSDIIKIRKDTRLQAEIAKDYGICFQTVSDIKLFKIWKYV